MAIEKPRRCGYRKVGGLYMVGDMTSMMSCGQFPFALSQCPCCGSGFPQGLGFKWTRVADIMSLAEECDRGESDCRRCPVNPAMSDLMSQERAGLLWVGKSFYPSSADFITEAITQGISKRIAQVPRGFKVGKTWVFIAHPEGLAGFSGNPVPAAILAFKPTRIEMIVTETQSRDPVMMEQLSTRGITPVVVPDGDPDHKGSVYKKKARSTPPALTGEMFDEEDVLTEETADA